MASAPHGRAVACPLCNEKFFPASLPFHQKQCEKRRAKRIVECPYCKIEVVQLQLAEHVKKCPKGRGRQVGGGSTQRGGGSHGSTAGGRRGQSVEPNNYGPGNFEPDVMDDGRMRCIYCGRYFTDDRIDKHQGICGKLKSARPVGVDGQPTQNGRKVFNSKAQRVEGGGSAFMTPQQYQRFQEQQAKEAEADRRRKHAKAGKWRREHEQFQEACRAGRGDDEDCPPPPARHPATPMRNQNQHAGKIQCHHCGRYFDEAAADRHIPICANVQNRPKPPPSPGPGTRNANYDAYSEPSYSPARSTTGRTPSRQGGRPPGSPAPRQAARTAPDGFGHSRSSSSSNLPQVGDSPTRGAPRDYTPSGGGARAARTLRQGGDSGRLPGVDSPGSTMRSGERDRTLRPPRPDDARQRADSVGRASVDSQGGGNSMARIGLRRSAMLYRLLSHVPREALERELADGGVSVEDKDEEGLIEAILAQLA
eukprot:TRINITY_DN4566_c0_g1_i2.p1 TRINITY_DN4566_c0_g1~~TRINITY_DN4566_c0_g1_i2.p1  ORF type:complete len:479 (+),score=89.12 TRINITY_DN4566_c0_g1_i2:205-1641(+)